MMPSCSSIASCGACSSRWRRFVSRLIAIRGAACTSVATELEIARGAASSWSTLEVLADLVELGELGGGDRAAAIG
jgi:hypothetical protein